MNGKLLATIFIFLGSLTACLGQEMTIQLDERSVILPADASESLWYLGFPGPLWRPSEAQVNDLMEKLPRYINEEMPGWHVNLDDYGGQFLGVTNEHGERLLYANFVCDPQNWQNWQSQLVQIEDGGDCYFQALYDPGPDEFLWLSVNGEA